MKIRLNEIPQEGREYIFDRKSGELNDALTDLIDKNPYEVVLTIKPIGNAYEMRGTIGTSTREVCSKCGYDFDLKIDRRINEILFEDETEYRKAHSVHGNQSVDFLGQGPSMLPYKGDVFDAGDYVHEVIALEEPFYPMCGADGECSRKAEVDEIHARLQSDFETATQEEAEVKSPFSVLKGLEVSRKN
ncbi:MAG TPA: DUF177 domain-containing protein [Bdellovibrionales bacterium]|nr:DUF177 domain-containing protein [Bdellovibrionales bacterium]